MHEGIRVNGNGLRDRVLLRIGHYIGLTQDVNAQRIRQKTLTTLVGIGVQEHTFERQAIKVIVLAIDIRRQNTDARVLRVRIQKGLLRRRLKSLTRSLNVALQTIEKGLQEFGHYIGILVWIQVIQNRIGSRDGLSNAHRVVALDTGRCTRSAQIRIGSAFALSARCECIFLWRGSQDCVLEGHESLERALRH